MNQILIQQVNAYLMTPLESRSAEHGEHLKSELGRYITIEREAVKKHYDNVEALAAAINNLEDQHDF